MINFINCGSEKRVSRFPSGNKLADEQSSINKQKRAISAASAVVDHMLIKLYVQN